MRVPDLLARIVERRRQRYGLSAPAADAGNPAPSFTGSLSSFERALVPDRHPFLAALAARRGRGAIAEVKMGSPRLGSLAGRFVPERQAEAYAEAGAAAISVVVEPDFFFGSFDLLARCRAASGLPAIAKDFVVSERQLDEAAAAGAEATLLVAALYTAEALAGWAAAARSRGLAPLVELHSSDDLARLAGGEWELVGVNNRDLRTFDVDLEHSVRLARRLPTGAIRVAESGIATRADVERLAAAGYESFLVGESLLMAGDPEAKLRELFG